MAQNYRLTREMADQIVAVVAADNECKRLLPKLSAYKIFSGIGHAGTARNFHNYTMELQHKLDNPWLAGAIRVIGDMQSCVGVARVTAQALTRARQARLPFIEDAGSIDRTLNDNHTATYVTIDGKRFVFDWHATLDLDCPLIFPSDVAFRMGNPKVRYTNFWGYA